jgi:hypothetical protein
MLECRLCGKSKPEAAFSKDKRYSGRNGRHTRCKDCKNNRNRERYRIDKASWGVVKIECESCGGEFDTTTEHKICSICRREDLRKVQTVACSVCTEIKPRNDFHSDKRTSTGKSRTCKTCELKKLQAIRRRKQQHVVDILKVSPCIDCGYSASVAAMQFDHVRGTKVANVSRLVQQCASIERIQREIEKCDIVCSNCHAVRTARQQEWYTGIVLD